jgi:hypothetical protein
VLQQRNCVGCNFSLLVLEEQQKSKKKKNFVVEVDFNVLDELDLIDLSKATNSSKANTDDYCLIVIKRPTFK